MKTGDPSTEWATQGVRGVSKGKAGVPRHDGRIFPEIFPTVLGFRPVASLNARYFSRVPDRSGQLTIGGIHPVIPRKNPMGNRIVYGVNVETGKNTISAIKEDPDIANFKVKADEENLEKLKVLSRFSPVLDTVTKGTNVDVRIERK
jgi:hypothetical protein